MKKHFLLGLLLLAGVATQAQDFQPFKVGLHLGYAAPADGGGGVAFAFEPAYRINDAIAVGLRIEAAALAKIVNEQEASLSTSSSYALFGQYYLSNNNFRPFVGLGLGLYSNATIEFDDAGAFGGDLDPGASFGFFPRIGFDLGHFNLLFDYNLVSKTDGFRIEDGFGNIVETDDIKNSYFSIKIGASIGGGRN